MPMTARRSSLGPPLTTAMLIAALSLMLAACSMSSAPGATAGSVILASLDPSLRDPFPLDGERVSGAVHVFVPEQDEAVRYVQFFSEDEGGRRVAVRRDHDAPYTPAPDGQPLGAGALGSGSHALVAELHLGSGAVTTVRARFEVAVEGESPAPPSDPGQPQPPTTPAPPVSPAPPTAGIWQPRPGTSWQWQLSGRLDTSVVADVYDVDLEDTPAATIAQLQAAGRRVICYFSAGSFEAWRSDAAKFPAAVKGKKMDGWDELWLDVRNVEALAPVMLGRLDLAAAKGCDAVEPDNVDGYANDTGFPLRGADQLAYNRWLAAAAHERGLAIGLKNDLDQVLELVDHFDFAVNEECFSYRECELLTPFVRAGKAVFGAEYELSTAAFCSQANALNMDFIRKDLALGAARQSCR